MEADDRGQSNQKKKRKKKKKKKRKKKLKLNETKRRMRKGMLTKGEEGKETKSKGERGIIFVGGKKNDVERQHIILFQGQHEVYIV